MPHGTTCRYLLCRYHETLSTTNGANVCFTFFHHFRLINSYPQKSASQPGYKWKTAGAGGKMCVIIIIFSLLLEQQLNPVGLDYDTSIQVFQENCSTELSHTASPSSQLEQPTGGERAECPPWWNVGGNDTCHFGPHLHGIGHNQFRLQTMLLECVCMTEEEDGTLVSGSCLYTCNAIHGDYPLPCTVSQLNSYTCAGLNRHGRLCGQCIDGYAPPVYSYEIKCVECKKYHYNWFKYIAAAFLPLTVFFIVVMIFSISLTSPRVSSIALTYQLLASPTQLKVLSSLSDSGLLQLDKNTIRVLTSMTAVWNLDFFRAVYKPFCLHPKVTTLHTLALDYAIAIYPLLLIILTYTLVTFHDKGFRLAVCIWGPVAKLSRKMRQRWHTKKSLIDVFASFIFLSTARLLSTSFVILIPSISYSYNSNASSSSQLTYAYNVLNAPAVAYFSWEYLPFAGTAVLVLVLLILLPMVLLFVYPFKCFQRLLNRLQLNSNSLRTFIEVFQGSLKNGTNNTRDYRSFSGLLLLLELVVSAVFGLARTNYYYPTASIFILIYTCSIAALQPYRHRSDYFTTVTMMSALLTTYMGITLNIMINLAINPLVKHSGPGYDAILNVSGALIGIGVLVPSLYLMGVVVFSVWSRVIRPISESTVCCSH